MLRMENSGENFSLGSTIFILPNLEENCEEEVLSQHFYINVLTTATNITIFLSNISKLNIIKHNQIIIIQTQKHNFKINQIITIKAKKKTKDRRQKPSDLYSLHWGRRWATARVGSIALGLRWIIWTVLGTTVLESSKKKKTERASWRKKKREW